MTDITDINAATAFGKGVCIREDGLYQKFINNQRVMATNNTQYKNTLDPNFMYNNFDNTPPPHGYEINECTSDLLN